MAPNDDPNPPVQGNLVNVRRGHRSWATQCLKKTDILMRSEVVDPEVIQNLTAMRDTLELKRSTLQKYDEQIQSVTPADNLETEILESSEIEYNISCAITKIKTFLESYSYMTKKIFPSLPKLELQPFSGDPLKFSSFWDVFKNSVHDNPELSGVQKFSYLQGLLKGEAAEAISGIRVSAENYETAINIINHRYNKSEVIVEAHLKNLRSLPSVKNHKNIRELRKHYEAIRSNVEALKSLSVTQNQYSALLIPLIIESLPSQLKIQITSEEMTGDATRDRLDCVLSSIDKYITVRERCFNMSTLETSLNEATSNHKPKPRSDNRVRGTAAFNTTQRQKCAFCDSASHPSHKCATIKDLAARKSFAFDKGLCFNCLTANHTARKCKRNVKCHHCDKHHNQAFCFKYLTANPEQGKHKTEHLNFPINYTTKSCVNLAPNFQQQTFLQTALISIKNPKNNKTRQIRALFDSGAQQTYLNKNVADILGLEKLDSKEFHVSTFGSTDTKLTVSNLVEFEIHKNQYQTKLNAYTVPHICNTLEGISLSNAAVSEFTSLNLADPSILSQNDFDIDLLIGSDLYWDFICHDNICTNSGPVAIKSVFGYILSGPVVDSTKSNMAHVYNACSRNSFINNYPIRDEQYLDTLVKNLWELEAIGIFPCQDQPIIMERFNQTIKYDAQKKRYCVSLPWRENIFQKLNDNKYLANKRLDNSLKRLNNPEFVDSGLSGKEIISEIESIFEKQLNEGIIERVLEDTDMDNYTDEISTNEQVARNINVGAKHYIPHRYILKSKPSTTKVRIVFDASAKAGKKLNSLNDCLHPGPPLQLNQIGILLRWRMFPTCIHSDIKQAFLQLEIRDADRDATRFLWRRGGDLNSPLITYRSTRVNFGWTCSPFLLNTTILHHLNLYENDFHAVHDLRLKKSVYVDDIVSGIYDKSNVRECVKNLCELMALGGFQLHKIRSNDPQISLDLNPSEKSAMSDLHSPDEPQLTGPAPMSEGHCSRTTVTHGAGMQSGGGGGG